MPLFVAIDSAVRDGKRFLKWAAKRQQSTATGVGELTTTPESDTGAPHIDADDREILNLLYAGLNDASIARQFGLGHRTIQRKVQRLMERLQANGRVALGARAQELGLLHHPHRPPRTRGIPPCGTPR
ncbi:LuxR C-terminal-related transcriptional regulator [Streptomyces sp. NPDC046197]|uniref:LuxR C-terminal-related transcriptional regulator n=1 Tax=Streptomyces sp. NPDC046197 TaxID=3154337 RepID=UPI0033DDE698